MEDPFFENYKNREKQETGIERILAAYRPSCIEVQIIKYTRREGERRVRRTFFRTSSRSSTDNAV